MRYCVNCGKEYRKLSGICPNCYSDQVVLKEAIEAELLKNKITVSDQNNPKFGFPGEKGALILSILLSAALAGLLGAISFGLFFGILVFNLVYLKIRHVSSQNNMIRISENSFKNIFHLAKVAAFRLKLPLPELFIVDDPKVNAFTMGFYRYGFIVISSSLASSFNPTQLMFVIGHELGHIKRYHTTWLNLLGPGKAGSAKFFFAPVLKVIFNVWSVKAEYTADQAGLIACRNIDDAVSSLLKIAGGPEIEKEVDIKKIFNHQGEVSEILSGFVEYLGSHPFINNRIKQLMVFSLKCEKATGYN
ncbi:MAG: hypothetical protein CMM60_00010 [Rhodospirillaceae bacterium]|jgi:Zn-dependent protease with chaperone function|nr:hypothetical protein [Rhodospirillaceae bacterium]|tara:strand:- start:982 stop:1893 length:912 start_codon:yes stop_codon:yes gene_type:complete